VPHYIGSKKQEITVLKVLVREKTKTTVIARKLKRGRECIWRKVPAGFIGDSHGLPGSRTILIV
jgi:hypothetical protein